MPPKRRIPSTDELPISSKRGRRSKPVSYNQSAIIQELYDKIRSFKDSDGDSVCELMLRVPKRRSAPDYFDEISSPIDLMKIQQKLKSDEYDEIEQLTEDVELLVNNTKQYFPKSTQEHKHALKLWSMYNSTKDELIAAVFGESASSNPTSEVKSKCKQLLSAVKHMKNGDRLLCEMFDTLPDKKALPIYYDVIKHPIDLATITSKLDTNQYSSIEQLSADLELMLKNATTFNEPGSQVYRDAETLRLMMSAVLSDINLSMGIKGKEKKVKQVEEEGVMEAETESEEDRDDNMQEDSSMISIDESIPGGNPYWKLFKTIATHTDEKGRLTAKPFSTLPNRRWFADYYDDIENPISMTQIKAKIKKNKYNSLNEMAADMNLMFENAKEYNADESKIFKNAIEMQSLMWKMRKELESNLPVDEEAGDSKIKGVPVRVKGKPGRKPGKTAARNVDQADGIKEESESPTRKEKRPYKRRSTGVTAQTADMKSMKKRLLTIYNSVYHYEDNKGRALIDPFIELPSRDEYPEYYDYINEPIDMNTIEERVQADRYESEKDLIMDLKLMFNNARTFNEDGSQLYDDANTLERVMKRKVMSLSIVEMPSTEEMERTHATISSTLNDKLKDLYETIKLYKDKLNRTVSSPFVKLPSKQEYPDYYEIIKKPIDLSRILQKIQLANYDSMESLLFDVQLLFDNAMTFNEPDSQLYKDAVILLHQFIERYNQLDDPGQYEVENVDEAVQEILLTLHQTTINHQNSEGQKYVDILPEVDTTQTNGLSFSSIGVSVKAGRYRRLDKLQEDLFTVCSNIRHQTKYDTKAYTDCVELQRYFIILRDKLCKNGDLLTTPALSYTVKHLDKDTSVDNSETCADKSDTGEESADEEMELKKPEKQEGMVDEKSIRINGETYSVGDFVYVRNKVEDGSPHIMNIHELYTNNSNQSFMWGCWFYRPSETFHLTTRMFLQQELFRTQLMESETLSSVSGKCYVMNVRDYAKNKPEGFKDSDVYLCESRYNTKLKSFKKIKQWSTAVKQNPDVQITARDTPIQPTRVKSVFAEGAQQTQTTSELDIIDIDRKTVALESAEEDGCTYFEQILYNGTCYKLGDCVYMETCDDLSHVAKIDKIFTNTKGETMFEGPWFIQPTDVEHNPARLFYHKELFLSSTEDKHNLSAVKGKCCVFWIRDYYTQRRTEVPEEHVFVCESKYNESDQTMRKLSKGFKSMSKTSAICDDEIYYLTKKINIKRIESPQISGILQAVTEEMVTATTDETKPLFPTTLGTLEEWATRTYERSMATSPVASISPGPGTPYIRGKKFKKRKHHITSFQIYANEIRKGIQDANPGIEFGELSRLLASKWKELPRDAQQKYKDEALRLANESKAKDEELKRQAVVEAAKYPPPPEQFGMQGQRPPMPGMTPQQRMPGHSQQYPSGYPTPGQQPMYPPHTQPQHPGMPQGQPGQTQYFMQQSHQQQQHPGTTPQYPQGFGSPIHRPSPAPTPEGLNQGLSAPLPPRPPSPKFVSVDLQAQKCKVSDVYLKYIGGLRGDNPVKVSNWEREVTTLMPQPPDPRSHPIHWLKNGPAAHGNAVAALHALRDHMMKDTFNLKRIHQL